MSKDKRNMPKPRKGQALPDLVKDQIRTEKAVRKAAGGFDKGKHAKLDPLL